MILGLMVLTASKNNQWSIDIGKSCSVRRVWDVESRGGRVLSELRWGAR
ncbi:hypothetical protein AG1IA_04562 [Rhizoctonia solani AG-1 IA]|uniref:Uncharacterized protein n=1 Tax=Thanatephorus cucumeris (strain AG1-IA) TaxID=983506 RepID=L8WTE7_THACA|nr:hypothetical protein AG1IA_04562 [Rhizoctonia solani AG-1 IA]